MKKLIFYEAKKIWKRKTLCFFLMFCFLINGMLIVYRMGTMNDGGYTMAELSQKYQEYGGKGLSSDAMEQEINELVNGMGGNLTVPGMKELSMMESIYMRCMELEGYGAYLDTIFDQTEKRLKSPLFSQPGTFTYRDLLKTSSIYEKLKGIDVRTDFDGGALLIVENKITDILLLIITAFLVIQVFLSERENGTWAMIKCMKLGHADLMAAKILTAVLSISAAALLLYGTNIGMVLLTVGLGDAGRPIQSLEGYMNSPFLLTVGQYIALFPLIRFITAAAAGCCLMALCMFVRNSVFAGAIGICIYAVEYLLARLGATVPHLEIPGQFNLAALNDTGTYYANYFNLNIFSYPLPNAACGIITAILCILCGSALVFLASEKERTVDAGRFKIFQAIEKKLKNRRRKKHGKESRRHSMRKGLWFYEWFKIYIINKGWTILLLFLCVQTFVFFSQNWFIDSSEFYYREYSQFLEGTLSEEKQEYLRQESEYFASLEVEREKVEQSFASGDIDWRQREYYLQKLDENPPRENAFRRAETQYGELSRCEAEGIPVEFIYRTPWEFLFGAEGTKRALFFTGEAFLVLILLFSSCGAGEKNGMELVINASAAGKNGILVRKICICIITAVFVWFFAFLPELAAIFGTYGLGRVDAPAASFLYSGGMAGLLTMGGYLLLQLGIRLAAIIAAGLIVLVVSQKVKNRIAAILIGTAVLLIPVIIAGGL